MPSSPSSSSSSSSSETERQPTTATSKRKFQAESDSDDSSSDSDSSSSRESVKSSPKANENDELPAEEDVPVLSHAAQRRQKKKAKLIEKEAISSSSSKVQSKPDTTDASSLPKRQNSVWVGNLSFKTTSESLKKFFEEAGEVTRVHMPTKLAAAASASEGQKWKGTAKTENRGFAYVDFSTPEEKLKAIAMSERNLDGRRLLIKDGDDFSNRPAQAAPAATPGSGHSKSAQRILAAQKRPPAPTLFVGNLGFEATEESIRKMIEAHGRAAAVFGKSKEKGKGRKKDGDLEEDGEGEKGDEEEFDVGIRKVRVGQFEDSGLCKGFAFIDFATTEQATAALTNPRNYQLDGRKLVLEYASADAVQRSGLQRDAEGKVTGERSGGGVKKSGKRRPDKQTRISMRDAKNAAVAGVAMDVDEAGENVEDASSTQHSKVQRPQRPLPAKTSKSNPRHRAKPGAALAQAQREKVAIVPSQGTRLVFS